MTPSRVQKSVGIRSLCFLSKLLYFPRVLPLFLVFLLAFLFPFFVFFPLPFSRPAFISFFLHSFRSFLHSFIPSFIHFFPSLIPAFSSCSCFPFIAFLSFILRSLLVLACLLHICSLAAFTSARLLPLLLLACCLYFCLLAASTSARFLLLLVFACIASNFLGGFVKWLVADCESLYLRFRICVNTTCCHICQF